MLRPLLAMMGLAVSLSALAVAAPAEAPGDPYPSAMADMAGIINLVGSMGEACSKVSPKLGEAVGTAAAKWRKRNQADVAEIERRVPALLDRIYQEERKEDPSVKRETVKEEFDGMIGTGRTQLAEAIDQSNGRACIVYIQYLGTERSNLANQPHHEMHLIRSRRLDGTPAAASKS
jgi:hypothetical protein